MKIKNIIKYLAIFLSVWVITFSIFVYYAQPNMLFRTWHNENAYNASSEEKSPTILYYLQNKLSS